MQEDNIAEKLKDLFGELTGEDLRDADLNTGLFDLGFDSLVLTQASGALKKHFNIKISFRELVESYTTIRELAYHISSLKTSEELQLCGRKCVEGSAEQHLTVPSAIKNEVSLTVPPGSVNLSDNVSLLADLGQEQLTGSTLERIMDTQLKVMELQLAMLRDDNTGSSSVDVLSSKLFKDPVQGGKSKVTIRHETDKTTNREGTVQHGPFRPQEKKSTRGFSAQQNDHIEWLTRRYVSRTLKSKEYTQNYREHFADPRAVAGFKQQWKELVYPIVSTKSSGAYLWDLDGNRWLDVTLGFGVNLLGHSPPFITELLKNQLDLGVEIGPQNFLAGEVAELICEFTDMDRVAFCNTGSEAVMAAIRICRTVTGRTRIVFFAGDYHGTFDEVLAKGVWPGDQPRTLPLAPGVAPNLISEVTVLEYGTDRSLAWIRQHAGELAAVMVEPVQSRDPGLQPGEFLKELRQITERVETPLIFDEVITGFRCHPGGAQAYFGVRADLATYGKIIGGGMPIGFVAGRKEYMDALDGGFWRFGDESFPPSGVTFFAGTFVRHPLAMVAARAMLLHLKKEGPRLQSDLADRTTRLLDDLNGYFRIHGVPLELNHFTSLWYPHFSAEVKYGSLLYYHLREKGLHIWEGRPCFLSTAHTVDDEEFIKQAFKTSVMEMKQGGFLPKSDRHSNKNLSREPKIGDRGSLKRFPLSIAQHEMWVGAQMHPEAAGPHHACTGIYLEGELDTEKLSNAIGVVVNRHEGLRCTFSQDGNEAVLQPSLIPEVSFLDFSSIPEDLKQEAVDSLLQKESQRLFDLIKGPLFDFQIVKLSDQRHMLIFTVQMIVCDGWSHYVVFEDLGSIYSALVVGEEPLLKESIPMWEYVNWEKANASSDITENCEDFWVSQFKNVPTPINIPTTRVRPPTRTFEGDRQTITLPADLFKKIRQLAKLQKNSYFAILLAAFGVWLNRLSRSEDVVVGVPFAAQGPLDMARLVGQCANILPLRMQLSPDDLFSDVLKNVWSSVLDAQEHWDFSFGRLISKLDLPNDPSRIPLVSVLFNLDPPMSKVKFSGLKHSFIAGPRYYFQYDMGFNLVECEDAIRVECDYNRSLFDGEVVKHWLAVYQVILETVVQKPDCPVRRLSMMEQSGSPSLSLHNKKEKSDKSIEHTIDAMFASQVKSTPDAIAIESESGSLTYQELDRLSSLTGNHLQSLGFGEGSVVGVSCSRSLNLSIVLLSILKSGGTYVLIDSSYPSEDVVHFADDFEVAVILTDNHMQPNLQNTAISIIDLSEIINSSDNSTSVVDRVVVDPDRLACIIYHGDSNDRAQGIKISHRTMVNCLLSMKRDPGMVPGDVALWHSPAISGFEIMELWLPLSVGAKIFVSENTIVLDSNAVGGTIDRQAITTMLATPSAWRMLLEMGWQGNKNLKALCWGESLRTDLAKELINKCGEVWSLYGTAEMAMVSMVGPVRSEAALALGQPISNTNVVVLDESHEPVPVGVPGELLLGGLDHLRKNGNNSSLAAENFIDLSIGDEVSTLFFRTGDLVRYQPGGGVEFCGRMDRLCSVNGINFQPGDIESVLIEHSVVRDVVVTFRRDIDSSDELVAYIVLRKVEENAVSFGMAEQIRELRRLVRHKLPGYMIPGRFVVLEDLPRKPDGRVDYAVLPGPGKDDFGSEDYVAPRNKPEEILAEIWQDLLKIEKINVTESFFDLGGQSLLAVRMFIRIEKEFGRKFPISMLFRAPTIDQLARKLSDNDNTVSAWPSLVPIQPEGDKPPLFLVHGAGGNVLLYSSLAKHLGSDYPLYGLQSQGLDGQSQPLKTIEEMADHYLQEIQSIQPTGPYLLGGYCLGGTIAYEMAQRLIARGEKVGMVAMFDTYNFIRALKVDFFTFLLQKIRFHLRNIIKLRPENLWKYLREKKRLAGDGGWAHIRTERPGSTLQDGVARAESGIEATVQELNDHAADTYDPKPYSGVLTLFKPHINYKFYPDPKMGWGDMALGGLDIVEMPINPHSMLLEPYVEILAQEVRSRVEQVP